MAHPTIQRGSKGDAVKLAQQSLIDRGYEVGSGGADGVFGNYTYRAVLRYQLDRASGEFWAFTLPLGADGIVGPQTWKRLAPDTVRNGDTGDEVELLQALLKSSEYDPWDPGTVDGKFGPHTEQAVRNFQTDLGLTVDGIAGRNTWTALWS
jgi:peptidoglycan hydrolase-like protein with peptidoglycan-binding domain